MVKRLQQELSTRRPYVALIVLMVLGVLLSVLFQERAEAAPYVNPFWANNSASPETAIAHIANLAMSPEGVDMRTGELFWDHFLFRMPGVLQDKVFSLRWRSMIGGSSQLGNGILPSWEITAKYVLLIPGNPNGPGGHAYDMRSSYGRIDRHTWNGAIYTKAADVFDTITVAGGLVTLTTKWGYGMIFDALGMPNKQDDPNLNRDLFTYNAQYQITGLTDDRGKLYTFARNANGYLTTITDGCSRVWTFTYDVNDNLKTIKTPTTPDQTSGITTTLNYDGQNRLTSVVDGRGNTVYQYAYVGATGQIASVTIDGNAVTFTYAAGVTTRVDRNLNTHRVYHTGTQVTKTDMLVGGVSKYATLYRYTGVFLSNVVLPRGNRIDFTFDLAGNLTNRRHRTTDTATNDPSDLVHAWTYNAGNYMTGYTDPLGNAWTFGRDAAGNLTTVTHPTVTNPITQTASRTYTYNNFGQVVQLDDEEGNRTDYSYSASGADKYLLTKIEVDPLGLDLETIFTYTSCGNVATRKDPNLNTTTNTWDNLRRLTQTQAPSPLNYKVKRNYDANGSLIKVEIENIDKDGNSVVANPWITHEYTFTKTDDPKTMVEEIDQTNTRTTTLDYDSNQNRIRVTKPEGNKNRWEFDERDLVIKHIRGETDAKASEVEYAYDLNGNLTTFTDGRDKVTTHTYDLFDRRTKTTNALSHYAESVFDKNGKVTKVMRKDSTDTELQRETYFWDERNRRWKVSKLFKDPSQAFPDAVTTYERLKTNHVKKITDPLSNVLTYTFDAALRRTKRTDAMGNEWSWTLDSNGNPTSWTFKEKDGGANVTHSYETTYDEINRRKTYVEIDRNDGSNKYTTNSYFDSRSNMTFLKNAEGNPTRWTFDGLNRMTKRERALTLGATIDDFTTAQVTEWGFDKNSRMTSHKDDGTNSSTWDYDALDRVTTLTYPDTKTVAYVHDANDNVTKITDPAGNVVDDIFDDLNRNTSRTVTLATGFLGTTSETRTYDALNRITVNRDNDYKLAYEYAEIGLTSFVYEEEQSYWGGTAFAKTVKKTYDAGGNRKTEVYPAGANLTLNFTYDSINQLSTMTDGTNTIASYTYIGLRKKDTTYENTAKRKNTYTGFRSELQSVKHETNAAVSIIRLDYTYNKMHDKTYERFGASGSNGDAFEYDKLRRLTKAWMGSTNPASPGGNPYTKTIDYNYDDDGNRTSVVVTPYQQAAQTTNYTTNNLYEYTAVGGTTHVWDLNGNLTDNGVQKFKYNYKNLIVEVRKKSDNSLVAEYMYDAEGRRVQKDVGGTKERYIRSRIRENSTNERPGKGKRYDMAHVVAVYDGSNNWLQNFVWNDETDGIQALEQKDVLDYDNDGNTTELTRSYYHRNALGSVMEITDANQAIVVSYRYDPYGNVTITRGGQTQTTDPLGQHWVFTGRFNDEETGLYYYRARYYDPEIGRFIQRDPAGYAEGPSLFEYATSRPPDLRDPAGLDDDDVAVAVVTTAATAGAETVIAVEITGGVAAIGFWFVPLAALGGFIAWQAPKMLFGPGIGERMLENQAGRARDASDLVIVVHPPEELPELEDIDEEAIEAELEAELQENLAETREHLAAGG